MILALLLLLLLNGDADHFNPQFSYPTYKKEG